MKEKMPGNSEASMHSGRDVSVSNVIRRKPDKVVHGFQEIQTSSKPFPIRELYFQNLLSASHFRIEFISLKLWF